MESTDETHIDKKQKTDEPEDVDDIVVAELSDDEEEEPAKEPEKEAAPQLAADRPIKCFVVINKTYHDWSHRSGPEDVYVSTLVYSTLEAAQNGMHEWMVENMSEVIVDHESVTEVCTEDPVMRKVIENLEIAISATDAKDRWNSKFIEKAIVEAIVAAGSTVEDTYREFFRRDEYASDMESMNIQRIN